jgi:hypothetical protein
LQQLFRWLDEEDEIPQSPMAKMRPPEVPEQPVPVMSDDDLAKLLKVCTGNGFEASDSDLRILGTQHQVELTPTGSRCSPGPTGPWARSSWARSLQSGHSVALAAVGTGRAIIPAG